MIRLKYYLKLMIELALAAGVIALSAYGLVHEEITLRGKAAEIYSRIDVNVGPAVLDLNTASERALQKINGIGEATARAIVEYRGLHGGFSSVDELLNIRGIGQATLEKLRPYLSV